MRANESSSDYNQAADLRKLNMKGYNVDCVKIAQKVKNQI